MTAFPSITIAIPTYNRGAILVETISRLLMLSPRADAILVADQTSNHNAAVVAQLERWHTSGDIGWLRLAEPSIPIAMNDLLAAAQTEIVLFLDDDVIPGDQLVSEHLNAHGKRHVWAVAGQVLQPGEAPSDAPARDTSLGFRFNGTAGRFITNVMAGNLSVLRSRALAIGGFDEQFVGAAYRFETDFALRLIAAGGTIWFEPSATLRHLQLSTGGLRSFGDHRSAAGPDHSVGDYYFARLHAPSVVQHALERLQSNVLTRHLALHPWQVPPKLIGEVRGFFLARSLYRKGRRLRSVPPLKPS